MAYIDWEIRGKKLGACNCTYGCPCEFNAPPTFGLCEGLEAMEIDEGHFADIRLDGLRYAARFRWPGPVHEGGGEAQAFIDVRASPEQRECLLKILGGEEQEPTTVFNIYGSTIETEHPPIFAPIEFEWDDEALTGRLSIPDRVDLAVEPIRNPVTGKPHKAIIRLPEGFEFREAHIVSSTFSVRGEMEYGHAGRYGQIWYAAYGPRGIIDSAPHRIALR